MKNNDELMLSESLSKTVFDSTKPLINDIGEATLDLFLNDGFAKNLPLINVACGLYNIGKTIQDANHRRNIVIFLESLRRGTITDEQKEKRRKYFNKNSKNASKEIEQILLILYQLTEKENAVYIGNFYLALIDEEITFDEFRTYVSTLQKLCPDDIDFLATHYYASAFPSMIDEHLLRLCGLGLMHYNYGEKPKFDLKNLTTSNEIDFNSLEYRITHFGINFVTIAKRDYGGLLEELKINS